MSETVDGLLDAAEIAMRSRGYHGVSFRELADDVGIKSASVHYYFPQKEDLTVALVTRYSKTFFADLDKRAGSAPSSQFRSAQILATLQGGMMIATTLKDRSLFDGVVKRVLADNAA